MRAGRVALGLWLSALLAVAAPQQLPWWWELSAPDDSPATPAPGNNLGGGGGAAPSGGNTATEDPFAQSSYAPCECGAGKSCVCVLYYQCQNDTIITTGLGLLDDRINTPKVETCPGVQRCCQEPPRRTTSNPNKPPTPVTPPTPPYVEPVTPTPTPTPPVKVPVGPVKSGCGVRRGQSPPADNSTTFAEFPWMLVVQVAAYPGDGKPPAFIFKCGASLVHPQVALTAAHCVKRLIPSDIKVRAGIWDLTATSEPLPHQERRVIRVIRHPLFEEKTLFNDIALLVLDKTFDEATNVEVTCLPPPLVDFTGFRCIATGWGTSSPDAEIVQTTMKKVELPVVSRDSCENELRITRLGRYFELHESFICAGGEPKVDTCRGDGGGPLVCPIAGDDGRYVQVGIVSWGIGCGGSRTPAVYASLSYFRDWVDKQLEENKFLNIAIPPQSVEDDERVKIPTATWG